MTDADLVFLPWVRLGASAALLSGDSFDPDQPGMATATASVTVNNDPRPASLPVTVLGPGHVTGLDRRQVVRTDPAPGSRSFESNYFPLVELDEPSLPWLFTPAGADAQAHLRPWLVLIVVKLHAGVRLDPPTTGPLPILRVANAQVELPNLEHSWAWAHAQVTSETGVSIDQQLAGNPERTVARLLCSRALEPNTEYLGCLVPAFELGRKAGLGDPITPDDEGHLRPAWAQTAGPVDLPVYYSWPFATGPGGDFQSLAMLLKARELPKGVGVQPIGVGESGLKSGVPAAARIDLAGALRPAGTPDAAWPNAAVQVAWEEALMPVLNAPANATAEADPLLAPPLYGGAQAGLVELDQSTPSRWFEQLNVLPTHRAIAHLGTRVVHEQQEALMASAWEQAADLERWNQQQRQIMLGWRVSTSLHRRYLGPMGPAVGLQVLAPAIPRIVHTSPVLAERIAASGLEATSSDVALRRVSRPRGTMNRRIQRVATTPLPRTTSVLTHLRPERLGERFGERFDERLDERGPAPTPGPVTLERVAAGVVAGVTWAEATAAAVAAAPRRPFFAFVPMGQPVPMTGDGPVGPVIDDRVPDLRGPSLVLERERGPLGPLDPRGPVGPVGPVDPIGPIGPRDPVPPVVDPLPPIRPRPRDSAAAVVFRQLAQDHLRRFLPERPVPSRPQRPDLLPLDDVWAEAIARTRPTETFAARVRAVFTLPGAPAPDEVVLSEHRLSPAFPQPMVAPLAELAQDLIVPGLSLVLPNTIVPLETNPAFVEAYMVGLNTEMSRELLWRGYPSPLDATYFDRFWDNASAPGRPPDIAPIGEWDGRSLTTGTSGENFVMLIRSELLQRYPDAIVYATRPVANQPDEDRHPIFTGGFAPDVRYFGFDIPIQDIGGWSIVIEEHPSAPRFGIEVGVDPGGTHVAVAPDLTNAALVAAKVRQLPVRITIPTSVLGLA